MLKTSRLLVHCSASNVKASRCVCLCALYNRVNRKRPATVGRYSNVPVHIHSTGFMYLIGTDKTITKIGNHIHKFHHPLAAQHFYIYHTQRLHVSAIHPGYLQGVCLKCATYMLTHAHFEEICNSLKMTWIYGRNT